MKIVECWEVLSWDGGERHNHKFFLLDPAEAERWKREHVHDSIRHRVFEFFDTVSEAEDNETVKVRERALAKLTAQERKALGFGLGESVFPKKLHWSEKKISP